MKIRPSPIAGRWYPGDPTALEESIDRYLEQANVQLPPGKIRGIVAPHAGYRYSGVVAAHAFKCLYNLQPELVVVISPLHHVHPASLLTTAYDAYETPLGIIAVDDLAVEKLDQALKARLGFEMAALDEDLEHSLEIELPFLQHVLGEFRLLPVMIRDQSEDIAEALGQALIETCGGQQVLFVASSDLSHFNPQKYACDLDAELLRRLAAFDPRGVLRTNEEGILFACGRGAIAATLWAAEGFGANQVTILHHATSGDVSGDYSSVVGYGAAVIWQARASET